ncbi:H/ACA ribonucleoprotein complex subunit [Elysia marginata]|uniref:H/ACA ribonucleoprotein complex subunit n=1 Tax=Elysia marginata TaxID=1093978 RepID=A0AAV4H4P4_9GAST|nr:H/ACA ribonucleoprotein complex subunit [Elysia marginata]
MSFRGGGRGGRGGGFRGGRGGGGFRGGRGRGGGYGNRFQDQGPPEEVMEIGQVTHTCEADLVCKSLSDKIPYFNAPIYLENKQQIGKVDEIFGPIKDFAHYYQLTQSYFAAIDTKDYDDRDWFCGLAVRHSLRDREVGGLIPGQLKPRT